MTTIVASPPSFQSLPRLGWNGENVGPVDFNSMSTDDVSRMFMPQRKNMQRTSSSSSIASSASSTSTVTSSQPSSATSVSANSNGNGSHVAKKKPRGGFWPASKQETASGVSNARAQGSTTTSPSSVATAGLASAILPSQNGAVPQLSGVRAVNGVAQNEPMAILALLPMNGTFERKQINVPFFPEVLRVGRQTNVKTVPTPVNGYFDSKVLSRQHAEVWAERNGKVWIRDVKSSNGTFVNGQRLSPENRDSEPHELHQHDTLELGIDIVSEDQKTIVHHKVSAKVEYVGLPGTSNNVLDLNFGDLDPSHGGPLLATPISSSMIQSRSRLGGTVLNGRSSASSIAGSHAVSMGQQREMTLWGAPLNVEQLVKTLSTEMRAAKMQSQDLEQADSFLSSIMSPQNSQEKAASLVPDPPRQIPGRTRALKVDPVARFADPPAPPPQQPLPEKPDGAQSSPSSHGPSNLLKRSDAVKPGTGSPTGAQSSQILSLVEALSLAKKELDTQGARVRHLELMLKEERLAREGAEERARRLEQTASTKASASLEQPAETSDESLTTQTAGGSGNLEGEESTAFAEQDLQLRLDQMVLEMHRMKQDMVNFQSRAEKAESEASSTRISLAEMITRLRNENAEAADAAEKEIDGAIVFPPSSVESQGEHHKSSNASSTAVTASGKLRNAATVHQANGHVRAPSSFPEHLQQAVATVLRQHKHEGSDVDMLAQSAPYVSMLGVVLIGVGLMAYLNSLQKVKGDT